MTWILALPALALAFYAHYRLPQYSEATWALWLTRVFLIVLGLGVAWASSFRYFPQAEGSARVALFVFGFGMAHFPAASVLFLKHWRRKTA